MQMRYAYDMTFLSIIVGTLMLLFLIWKVRYRYPPEHVPQALCYHKLSGEFLFEGTWMTPRRFLKQVDHLREKGYEFFDEEEFASLVSDPTPSGSRKILLTFDDGYEELYDMYARELESRRIPMVVFLVTDYVGQENDWDLSLGRRPFRHLSWDQIAELSGRGVSFGSHGATHRDLTRITPAQAGEEIARSKKIIEEHTQSTIRSFSYPFGRYNTAVRSAVREAGFSIGFSLYPPHSNESIDPLALRRNGVYIIDTPFTIDCKLTRNPLFWFEEMKCRAINQVAALTPMLKRPSTGPGK